jgi:hypothetical protein
VLRQGVEEKTVNALELDDIIFVEEALIISSPAAQGE